MTFFERVEIRALSERLLALAAGQGILLTSRAGRELEEMLRSVCGVQPIGRGERRQLTERGREFLIEKLAQTAGESPWSGEAVLAALGGQLPASINSATLSGLWLQDCKAILSPAHLARAEALGVRVFNDEVIRLRSASSLSLLWKDGSRYCADESLNMLGEIALPERALARLQGVEWQGKQIITVENKGAFVDYPLQQGELLLYVPGRNTVLAKQVIPLLPAAIAWAHFGDLDQRGVEIASGLAVAMERPLALWLPEDLMEYTCHYARPLLRQLEGQKSSRGKIPWRLASVQSSGVLIEALTHLITHKAWLEQEVLVSARRWKSWSLRETPMSLHGKN